MKRCPQCGREYDTSMMFCLDDGAELLYGPGSADEPATALLHGTDASNEAATRAQIHMTNQTEVLPTGTGDIASRSRSLDKRLLAAPFLLALIALGGFFAYRYFISTGQIESIAVMPFVNETGNAEVEYLSDGMTETLIKSLSSLPNVRVKPRSSVFRYKGKDVDLQTIAKDLNVHAIVNGRVTQRGDQISLSLELVDVRNDNVIWTEQYQRNQADIVSLQTEIARDVSTKISPKLSGADETKITRAATADPEAYQSYLKGRYYWNRRTAENLKKAMEQFKAATDRDPNYALAFVGLADCYAVLHEYAGSPTSETLPEAKRYAERALSLDPSIAEAHATLGVIYSGMWQWAESEKEHKLAIELNPNYATAYHWYSLLLKDLKRYDEASAMIKRAQELDPLSSVIGVNISRMYLDLQNNPEASIQNSLKLIELDPTFAAAYEFLGLAYLDVGRNDEALASLEKAVALSNRASIALSNLGHVYAATGKREEARSLIKELEEKYARHESNGQYIAIVYAGLGEKDKAFEWLEKDFQIRNGKLSEIDWTYGLRPLKGDPRFKDLLRRMNLPE